MPADPCKTVYLQISTKYGHTKKIKNRSHLLLKSLFTLLGKSRVSHSHSHSIQVWVSSGSSLLALLGWLTACDVSHFRLDSTEAWCSAIFLSLPSQQPNFNACTGSGHSNAAVHNPHSHTLPWPETQDHMKMTLRCHWGSEALWLLPALCASRRGSGKKLGCREPVSISNGGLFESRGVWANKTLKMIDERRLAA